MIPPNYPVGAQKNELDEAFVHSRVREAIEVANERLRSESLAVSIEEVRYPDFVLRVTFSEGESFCIDIVHPFQGINETRTVKGVEILSEQILNSVHLLFKIRKIEGFLISASGSKFDIRGLFSRHVVAIDPEGYLRVNSRRLACFREGSWVMIPAKGIRSESIMRLVPIDDDIYIVDKNEVVRPDNVGMRILSGKKEVEVGEYLCYRVDRPILDEQWKAKITQVFQSWPGDP